MDLAITLSKLESRNWLAETLQTISFLKYLPSVEFLPIIWVLCRIPWSGILVKNPYPLIVGLEISKRNYKPF